MSDEKFGKRVANLERNVAALRKDIQNLQSVCDPRKNHPGTIGEKHDPNKEDGSLPLGGAHSIIAAQNPNRSHNETEDTPPRWIVRVLIRPYKWIDSHLQQLGIWFAIGYAIVTALQWYDLRRNYRADERSWTKIRYGWPSTLDGEPFEIQANLSNAGKSVITDMYGMATLQIVDATEQPYFKTVEYHSVYHVAPVFPGDDTNFTIYANNPAISKPRGINWEEANGLEKGTKYLAVLGMIVYYDQFGAHWYRFCSWHSYGPTGTQVSAGDCVFWNAGGDGENQMPIPSPPILDYIKAIKAGN